MGLRGVLLVHGLALSVGWLAPGVHAPRARGAVRMAAFSGEEPWNPNAPTPRARERVSLSPIDMHELQARINFSREQQTLRERCEHLGPSFDDLRPNPVCGNGRDVEFAHRERSVPCPARRCHRLTAGRAPQRG